MRKDIHGKKTRLAAVLLALATVIPLATPVSAAAPLDPVAVRAAAMASGLDSLRNVPVPQVNNIGDFLNAGPGPRSMAVVLGKSLFWDMQVGSDGQACASCHFSAGADNRTKNQLNPGFSADPQDTAFGNSSVAGIQGFTQFGPNYQVTASGFSFHQVTDVQREDYNHRVVVRDTNDVMSSQGPFKTNFTGVVPGQLNDAGTAVADAVFNVGGVNVRRVEPRNTPTVINAVYNPENFWDGRARNQFNGINPFGVLDGSATVLVNDAGTLRETAIIIPNSSLASQATGPPLSDLEMSYIGRTFPDIGKKLLPSRPLAFQAVHADDSVLGTFSRAGQNGLTFTTYREMVQAVFQSKYWDSDKVITFNPDGTRNINNAGFVPPAGVTAYTEMEANFSLFFGLAVQAYESTLVSDRTRFDRFMEGDDLALTQDELAGLLIFINTGAQAANPLFAGISQGSCVSCHKSALFSDATYPGMGIEGPIEVDLAPIIVDGLVKVGTELIVVDNGFYNIGVHPTSEDIGRGGNVLGKPLSATRQALLGLPFAPRLPAGLPANPRVAVDGAFKVPGLRNVELTGPYFHNGCQATLAQVLDFYHRHADYADVNIANLDSPMANVKLDGRLDATGRDLDADQMVKFLVSLTDERVRHEMAPFDHPQLLIPNGHPGDATAITGFTVVNGVQQANDTLLELPAVGRDGREAAGLNDITAFLGSGALQAITLRLRPGWNILSTPIRLHESMDTWGELATVANLNYQTAYRWDGAAFQIIAAGYTLNPLEAIYVKMNTSATVEIVPYAGVSAPPSRQLTVGWNLIGLASLETEMPVKDALVSVFFVPNGAATNALPLWGYSQVVSPMTNAFEWAYTRDSLVIPGMHLGEGYWIAMVNPGQLTGFTSTPLR